MNIRTPEQLMDEYCRIRHEVEAMKIRSEVIRAKLEIKDKTYRDTLNAATELAADLKQSNGNGEEIYRKLEKQRSLAEDILRKSDEIKELCAEVETMRDRLSHKEVELAAINKEGNDLLELLRQPSAGLII